MGIILSAEIIEIIEKELVSATQSVHIITAFCKENAFEFINNFTNHEIQDKKILVRFRLSDIVSGVTDFNIYNVCKTNGWKLYINLDLHAKTYLFDKKRCILGSANLTNKGFSLEGQGNEELSGIFDLDIEDVCKVEALFRNSILMTDEMFNRMATDLASVSVEKKSSTWGREILELCKMALNTLFSYELPQKELPCDYLGCSIDFLELDSTWTYDEVKIKFRHSKVYRWLCEKLRGNGGEMFFGAISSELHNALISDPKPYRKDVKEYLINLLRWIEYFDYADIIIDRPNYSQRVKLVEVKAKTYC